MINFALYMPYKLFFLKGMLVHHTGYPSAFLARLPQNNLPVYIDTIRFILLGGERQSV